MSLLFWYLYCGFIYFSLNLSSWMTGLPSKTYCLKHVAYGRVHSCSNMCEAMQKETDTKQTLEVGGTNIHIKILYIHD